MTDKYRASAVPEPVTLDKWYTHLHSNLEHCKQLTLFLGPVYTVTGLYIST